MTKWIKEKIRWILGILGICALTVFASTIDTKTPDEKLLDTIDTTWEQILETQTTIDETEITYKKHIYEAPEGKGVQIIMEWKDDKGTHIKSIGTGVEADSKTYEYTTPLPVATSTNK